jgi:hypothetical protein
MHTLLLLIFTLLQQPAIGNRPPQSTKPDFSGNWQLNRELSEGLQSGLAKTDVFLKVEQTASQLKIEQRVKFRGRDQSVTLFTYNLDGTPSEAPVSRPAPGKAQLQARWLDKGRTLELRSTLKAKVDDEEVTATTREYWELLDKGKTLKINRTREQPNETQTSRLIFDKQ